LTAVLLILRSIYPAVKMYYLFLLLILIILGLLAVSGSANQCELIVWDTDNWFPKTVRILYMYAFEEFNEEFFEKLSRKKVDPWIINFFHEKYVHKKFIKNETTNNFAKEVKLKNFDEFYVLPFEEKKDKYEKILKMLTYAYTSYRPVIRTDINIATRNYPSGQINGLSIYRFVKNTAKYTELLEKMFGEAENYGFAVKNVSAGIQHLVLDPEAFGKIKNFSRRSCSDYLQDWPEVQKIKNGPFSAVYNLIAKFYNEKVKIIPDMHTVSISIAKHTGDLGIRLHMDGLGNSDLAISAVNLGRNIYYDMFPIFCHGNPMRFLVPDGSVVTMSDSARYEWAHAIPDGLNLEGRYAIIFKARSAGKELSSANAFLQFRETGDMEN
jgi:hypothetical protein